MKKRIAKKYVYSHSIDLALLTIKNQPREDFRRALEHVAYRGYEVEQISDGRKIVITKPGGKSTYGQIRREDLMVWVYDPEVNSLWLISHRNILQDLEEKAKIDSQATVRIINSLEKVFNGEDPDEVLKGSQLSNPTGESPEVLLKVYKWIWGQEDCNYPDGKGRAMSWEGWLKQDGAWVKTGQGIVDLKQKISGKTI